MCGTASLPTMGRGISSSLEVCEEPRSWSVDGYRLGLPLSLLCLSNDFGYVSSAADGFEGLELTK